MQQTTNPQRHYLARPAVSGLSGTELETLWQQVAAHRRLAFLLSLTEEASEALLQAQVARHEQALRHVDAHR